MTSDISDYVQLLRIVLSTREVLLRNARPYLRRGASGTEMADPELMNTKRNSLHLTSPKIIICSDAAKTGGWGAVSHSRSRRGCGQGKKPV